MIEIIKHTPIWVFILLIALIYLGYSQSKSRYVSQNTIFILPFIMILLSLFGVISTFGIGAGIGILLWIFSFIMTFVISNKLFKINNVRYNYKEKTFFIKGSWVPMVLIMFIFLIKYIVGAMTAMDVDIVNSIEFFYIIIILYGIISGIFLSRTILIYKKKINK